MVSDMLPTLENDVLRTFICIAETRNFTRAGDQLGRTQSAVSMQIKRLEERVGVRLLDRDGRGVALTPEGEFLLGHARRMLKLNDQVMAHFLEPEIAGPVRVGTPDDYATYLLPAVLSAFGQSHPAVRVDVTCDNSVDVQRMLMDGELDIALISRGSDTPGGETVRTERLHWVTSATHTTHEEMPLPLAMFPDGCICRRHAITALDRLGRDWRAAYSSRSITAIHGAIIGGFAISILEESTIPPGLRILAPEEGFPALPDVEVTLHVAPGDVAPAVDRLADHIRETLGGLTREALPAA